MLNTTNINGMTVQIVAFSMGWTIFAGNEEIQTAGIKTGKALVDFCNAHDLIVDNPDCLIPALRDKLNNHN